MKILNTRPRQQSAELSRLLREAGYDPIEVPLVELILIPEGMGNLAEVPPDEYDGILLSSPNLLPLLAANRVSMPEALLRKNWYLISHQARSQVEALGAKVAFVPNKASLEGFLREISPQRNLRLLHLCSKATRLDLKLFRERGVVIRNIFVYEPHCPSDAASELQTVWPRIQAVLFASGSAVRNLFAADSGLAGALGTPAGPLPISIGPSASDALRAGGVVNFREAATADNAGLIAALKAQFPNSKGESP